VALAGYFELGALDFTRANKEYERALALAPGKAMVLGDYGTFAVFMGRKEAAIAAARRAIVLDPLNRNRHLNLGEVLYFAHQYDDAIAAFNDTLALDPDSPYSHAVRGLAYYALGNLKSAQASCERKSEYIYIQTCLAIVYDKLGQHANAESMFAKMEASQGEADAYEYAEIYAQRGNTSKALEWLETALRLRDPGLEALKTDPLLDPLRKEPRLLAVMRELKFPQ